jgi:membrane-bound serine protease (ClpP class)
MGWRRLFIGGLIAGAALLAANQAQAQEQGILVTEVIGPITPAVALHLESAVESAAEANSILLVLIDTPGGLDVSTRQIVQGFLNAPVPVVAYVQPSGARAASAGTFIVMSAHVAAMAPATTIGAATPVDLQTGEEGSDKVINDSAAFAVSVAEQRGRSVEFAEAAVREGRSITAREAEESNVVDLLAGDVGELLAAIDGLEVEVRGAETTIRTAGVVPETFEMSTLGRILSHLADPNIAVLFLSLGTLAIIYEAANPGLGFAGMAGIILLLIGFFALSVLPVQVTGVALLILAAALFIGELFVPGVGVLAAGGTIALLLSGVFLFEGDLEVSPPVLWPTALLMGLFTAFAGRAAVRARLRPSTTGADILLGRPVTVQGDPEKGWSAFLEGSWWTIRPSSGELQEGDRAEVVGRDGLELLVDPIGERDDS